MTDNNQMFDEEMEDVIILIDEDDQEHAFAMIDMLEVDGKKYAVLSPLDEEEESDEAMILRIETDEKGEEVLYDIEDDEEWEKVVDIWNEGFED